MSRTGHTTTDGESGGPTNDSGSTLCRREFVVAGLAAGGTVLAGCSSLPGPPGGGGAAAYRNWVPASLQETPTGDGGDSGVRSNGERLVAYVDLQGVSEVAREDPDYGPFSYSTLFSIQSGSEGRPNDPLLAPAAGLPVVAVSVGFAGGTYPFVRTLLESGPPISAGTPTPTATPAEARTPTPDIGDTTADEWILAGSTFVARGSVDPRAVVDAAGDAFSEAGNVGPFTVYTADGGSQQAAFAVTDDTVALTLGDGGRAELEPVLEAKTGGGPRLHTRNDDVKWAFEAAGAGDIAFGAFPNNSDSDSSNLPRVARGATFVMTSIALESEDATATMAITYESGGQTPARGDIRGAVGNTTSSTNVSIDGTYVEITGTWEA